MRLDLIQSCVYSSVAATESQQVDAMKLTEWEKIRMIRATSASLLLTVLAGHCSAQSQTISVQYDAPSLDRWNYPFNGAPGTRLSASTISETLTLSPHRGL